MLALGLKLEVVFVYGEEITEIWLLVLGLGLAGSGPKCAVLGLSSGIAYRSLQNSTLDTHHCWAQ